MKRLVLVCALALSLGGCSTANLGAFLQNLADVESQAVDIVNKVRAGIAVANATVDQTITSVCAAVPQLNTGMQNFMAAVPNPGPKTKDAIRTASISLTTAANACNAYVTAPPSASGRVTVLRNLWAAYTAAKQSLAAANAAPGA
jgi:PBP1b-binding outer membrane lipoprotein LpoB